MSVNDVNLQETKLLSLISVSALQFVVCSGKGVKDKRKWWSIVGSHDRADAIWLAEVRNTVLWLNSHHFRTPKVHVQLVLYIYHQYPADSNWWVYLQYCASVQITDWLCHIGTLTLCWIVWHNVHSQQWAVLTGPTDWVCHIGTPHAVCRGGCLELYYCSMVEWFWWYSSLIFDDQLVSFSALTLLVWSSGL